MVGFGNYSPSSKASFCILVYENGNFKVLERSEIRTEKIETTTNTAYGIIKSRMKILRRINPERQYHIGADPPGLAKYYGCIPYKRRQ